MCVHWFVWRNSWKNCLSTTYLVTKSKVHHFRAPLSFYFLVRDLWGATENTGSDQASTVEFWCLASAGVPVWSPSYHSSSGHWGESAPSHPLILRMRRRWREADERRRRKCLRVRRLVAWTENRDFSYQLIETGSSPRDWIKEVHLVFICRRENFH